MKRLFSKNTNPEFTQTIQFELAITNALVFGSEKRNSILLENGLKLKSYKNRKNSIKLFTFSQEQLQTHFQNHPELVLELYSDSGDKCFSPSTLISHEKNGDYSVGIYDNGERKVQYFTKLEDAVTDYVLLSVGLPRLIM